MNLNFICSNQNLVNFVQKIQKKEKKKRIKIGNGIRNLPYGE